MSDREHPAWAETALRYLDALDAGDVPALIELWEQAVNDPHLERVLAELTDGLAIEEGPSPAWEAKAAGVRTLLQQHLPSAAPPPELPPLTVGDVAARLKTDATLGARLSAADRAANERLLADGRPVPDRLGLPYFEAWKNSLGVGAGAHYWRVFRQAAVLLAMGRCQRAGELAAARRAARGGRS